LAKLREVWSERWERVEKLPGGGQAHTWTVRRKGETAGDLFVLKLLKRQDEAKYRQRMNAEVANLQQLQQHRGVAKVVESNASRWSEDEQLYLVTEYVPGKHLADVVGESGRVSVRVAVPMVRQLLDTLRACHDAGVVHRDIKPENIILRNGEWDAPVLLDFGISFNSDVDAPAELTEIAEAMGNRFLRLPELEAGSLWKRDPRIDLTQCVGILFYLVTGQPPRVLADERGIPPHQRSEAQKVLGSEPEEARNRLRSLFDTGFTQSIDARWQSQEALDAALARVLEPVSDTPFNVAAEIRMAMSEFRAVPAEVLRRARLAARTAFTDAVANVMNEVGGAMAGFSKNLTGQGSKDGRTWTQLVQFLNTADISHRVTVRLQLRLDETEAVLLDVAEQDSPQEILRLSVLDRDLPGLMLRSIERFAVQSVRAQLGLPPATS